ncbi:MAG: HNH endonuclease signature motif containing protein [Bdellovibrionota bacterium]
MPDTELRLKLNFSVPEETQDLINEAKRALSGKLPGGVSLEDLFTEGLKAIVAESKRKAKSLGSRASRGSTNILEDIENVRKSPGGKVNTSRKKQSKSIRFWQQEPDISLGGWYTSRHIPNQIRKAVLERDGNKCTYVSETGKACGCSWDLEIDHITPFAEGGQHTVDNLRVLCRSHNQYLAEQKFGRVWERAA